MPISAAGPAKPTIQLLKPDFPRKDCHMNTPTTNNNDTNAPKKKMTSKQIVAIAGVVILVLMYIVTLIVAIVDSSASGKLFALCLFASIALPILIWIYSWLYQKYADRDKE